MYVCMYCMYVCRLEVSIEEAVKECIVNLRTDAGLQSFFDEQLAVILQVGKRIIPHILP